MIRHLFILLNIFQTFKQCYLAKISYIDNQNVLKFIELELHVKNLKGQKGVEFGIPLIKFNVENCQIGQQQNLEGLFAALIYITDSQCQINRIIDQLSQQGANFVFIQTYLDPSVQHQDQIHYHVPTIFINNADNADFFQMNSEQLNKRRINIFIQDDADKVVRQKVLVELFYTPSYHYTQKFISVIEKISNKLQNKLDFVPRIVSFKSQNENIIQEKCLSQGQYCAYESNLDIENQIFGVQTLIEGLRQKCIQQIYNNKTYFQYMDSFFKICLEKNEKNCQDKIYKKNKIDQKIIQKCVGDSFLIQNDLQSVNKILHQDREWFKELGLISYPQIYINGQQYKGSLDQNDFLFAICAELNDENKHCLELDIFDEENFIEEIKHIFLIFFFGLIIIGLVIKKQAERRFQQQIKSQINQYVSEYTSIQDEKKALGRHA